MILQELSRLLICQEIVGLNPLPIHLTFTYDSQAKRLNLRIISFFLCLDYTNAWNWILRNVQNCGSEICNILNWFYFHMKINISYGFSLWSRLFSFNHGWHKENFINNQESKSHLFHAGNMFLHELSIPHN